MNHTKSYMIYATQPWHYLSSTKISMILTSLKMDTLFEYWWKRSIFSGV